MSTASRMSAKDLPEMLTPENVAQQLGVSERILAYWRRKRLYLPFLKIGKQVRYRAEDIATFIRHNTQPVDMYMRQPRP